MLYILKNSFSFLKIYVPKKNFGVSFGFCRYPLRVEHQAVNIAKDVLQRVFPNPENVTRQFKNLKYVRKRNNMNENVLI